MAAGRGPIGLMLSWESRRDSTMLEIRVESSAQSISTWRYSGLVAATGRRLIIALVLKGGKDQIDSQR
jgi:hypothetical protein